MDNRAVKVFFVKLVSLLCMPFMIKPKHECTRNKKVIICSMVISYDCVSTDSLWYRSSISTQCREQSARGREVGFWSCAENSTCDINFPRQGSRRLLYPLSQTVGSDHAWLAGNLNHKTEETSEGTCYLLDPSLQTGAAEGHLWWSGRRVRVWDPRRGSPNGGSGGPSPGKFLKINL